MPESLTNPREDRDKLEQTLAFKAERLEKRLVPLHAKSRRLSTLRLAIVVAGLIIAAATAVWWSGTLAWIIVGLTLLLFGGVALWHQRLELWIETLTLWRSLKLDQLARMRLAWDDLPAPRPIELRDNPLARDLDLVGYRSLHHLLDTTISRHGTQRLAEWLTRTRPEPAVIVKRQEIVRELRPRAQFRERFRLIYRLVLKRELEGDNLLDWLKTDFPSKRLARVLPIAVVLVALNLVLFALSNLAGWPPYWIVSLTAYLAFYYWNQNALATVLGAVVRVNAELEKFRALLRYLESASYEGAEHLAAFCEPLRTGATLPSRQLQRIGWITAAVGLRSNPLLGLLLNLVLPWDFVFAFLADRQRAQVAQVLPQWVQIVHELDTLIALATFAYLNPEANMPEIRPDVQPVLVARQLGHPLIPAAARVCNDFEIGELGHVAVLTGSNMAGKSTFLKTLGVNLCLAYAGAPVIGSHLAAQPFRLHTCIRISDSIVDGFSYFYAEVKCLKQLLVELQAEDALPLLYFVDEIFRGTNNRERFIGSRSFIQSLIGARGAGLIATHDLELARLAETDDRVYNLHFRDEVSDGRLVFDYRLRSGPCPTTNALKIMQLEGLPVPA